MLSANHPVNIVATLQETQREALDACELVRLLQEVHPAVNLWSDKPSPLAANLGSKVINAFNRQFPKGGTLIIFGNAISLDPWINYAKPQRLIVICTTLHSALLFALLTRLEHPSLPTAELVFVSQRLQTAMGLPGRISPLLIDHARFKPVPKSSTDFTIGRLSHDIPEKHHPDDPILYGLLAWHKARVRVMGGTCLGSRIRANTNIELLPANTETAPDFLNSLDAFFYRTSPGHQEAGGQAVMEALACGRPVVAHVDGGYTDWVEQGRHGYLFSAQEEAWEHLKRLQAEPSLRRQLGENAAASVETWAGKAVRASYQDWLLADR